MKGQNGEFGCPGTDSIPPTPPSTDGTNVTFGIQVINNGNETLEVQIIDDDLGINKTILVNGTYEGILASKYVLPDDSNSYNTSVDVTAFRLVSTGVSECSASDSVLVERASDSVLVEQTSSEPATPVSCNDIEPLTSISLIWGCGGAD
jgi:hypothetical protein